MRGHRYTVAVACTALGLAAGAAPAQAAHSTHLTASAWRVLSASAHATTAASCNGLAKGTTDEQTRGVVGLCVDGADDSGWEGRLDGDCHSSLSSPICVRDVSGEAADLKAAGAWAGWFTGQLDAGGCQSFFSTLETDYSQLGSSLSTYETDLRAHRSASRLYSDFTHYLSKLFALSSRTATSTARNDLRACNPAA